MEPQACFRAAPRLLLAALRDRHPRLQSTHRNHSPHPWAPPATEPQAAAHTAAISYPPLLRARLCRLSAPGAILTPGSRRALPSALPLCARGGAAIPAGAQHGYGWGGRRGERRRTPSQPHGINNVAAEAPAGASPYPTWSPARPAQTLIPFPNMASARLSLPLARQPPCRPR